MKGVLLLFLTVGSLDAAEMTIHRDLSYADTKNKRQTLDVYTPAAGGNHPVVVWIHGGGWRRGDKSAVQRKPQAFVDKGFVFVSVNYRFVPQVTVKEMAGDVAKAIRWVHDHARKYGGDPETVFVAGHSAGAHLAALVCTDESYLKAEKLSLSNIKGCIPVDTAVYDVAKQIQSRGRLRAGVYTSAFGRNAKTQKSLSPIAHVANGRHIPPFLILHVARRPDSTAQSQAFAKALQAAGVEARTVPGRNKTHGTINRELGLADDEPTKAVFGFLDDVLKRSKFPPVRCEGRYRHHLQGICTDDKMNIFWSFTTTLVKTNAAGKVLKKVPVASHHGDLCFHGGKIYIAVNLGAFNRPAGKADSWVYVYDAGSLKELARHRTPEVVHGAGGIGFRDGRFVVIGGLPKGVKENYAYEYDAGFKFRKRHVIQSGYTLMGIQTAAFHDGHWWFGCYGSPRILLKTDKRFRLVGKYEFDCSLGVVGVSRGKFLIARGSCSKDKGCVGRAVLAKPDDRNGIVVSSQ